MNSDLREAVARAICYQSHCAGKCRQEGVPCKALTEYLLHETCTIAHQADAAIAAVVERCAQVAGGRLFQAPYDDYPFTRVSEGSQWTADTDFDKGRQAAAEEIRALAKKE